MWKTGIEKKLTDSIIYQSIRVLSQTIFTGLLIFYLILLILDQFSYGFVSSTFNPNLLIWPLVILGIIFVILPNNRNLEKEPKNENQNKFADYLLLLFIGLASFFVIYYKLNIPGKLDTLISLFSSLLIITIGFILLFTKKETNEE